MYRCITSSCYSKRTLCWNTDLHFSGINFQEKRMSRKCSTYYLDLTQHGNRGWDQNGIQLIIRDFTFGPLVGRTITVSAVIIKHLYQWPPTRKYVLTIVLVKKCNRKELGIKFDENYVYCSKQIHSSCWRYVNLFIFLRNFVSNSNIYTRIKVISGKNDL